MRILIEYVTRHELIAKKLPMSGHRRVSGYQQELPRHVRRPPPLAAWAAEAFSDLEGDVKQSINRIKSSPYVPHEDSARGFIFEVDTGGLREISLA